MNQSSLHTIATPTATASLLNRILQTTALVHEIQALPAHSLLTLVNKVGLEDSGELLALATTAQLTRMIDEDLWRQQNAGGAEEFSFERLTVWLSVLEELGPGLASEKLSELDEDFLCYAFGHYLHCLELEALQFMLVNVQGDQWQDARLENLLESHNTQEIGEFLVLAKATAPWDLLLSLLLALDDTDTSLCGRLLRRLCAATEEKAEKEGGLFEVLSGEEMLESDARFSRQQRRSGDGFVPAEDAIAFREWLRVTPVEKIREMKGRDPVSRAYFREYKGEVLLGSAGAGPAKSDALLKLLAENGDAKSTPIFLEGGYSGALGSLAASLKPEDRARLLMDLNFLAQVLMLTEPDTTRPSEAAEKVLIACEAGLKKLAGSTNAIQLFCVGKKG